MKEPLGVVIAGPTTCGKTDVAFTLAKRIGGEVINADAYYFYDAFPIGSGFSDYQFLPYVPMHHYATLDATESLPTSQEYAEMALSTSQQIRDSGGIALVEGCSYGYIEDLLDLSRSGEDRYDPVIGLRWHPGADIRSKIVARLDQMIEEGIFEEIEQGLSDGLGKTEIMRYDVIVANLVPYVRGKVSLEQALETTVKRYLHFALDGLKEFEKIPGIQWLYHDSKHLDHTVSAIGNFLPLNYANWT